MTVLFVMIFGALFGLFGGIAEGDEGFVLGVVIGILTGLYAGLRRRTASLERRLGVAESELDRLSQAPEADRPAAQQAPEPAVAPAPPPQDTPEPIEAPPADAAGVTRARPSERPDSARAGTDDGFRQAPGVDLANRIAGVAKSFFTSGNVVVKVGVVVLFFGVSFLIKYAHERELLPIEFRLTAVALFGIGLLFVGWKLRQRNSGYAMAIQGGAIGILYLTVFGAARLYDVLPLGFAFVVMLALVALSGALAVLQNAPALAVFGSAGGFLAPVLTSTGQGSHVSLFSYYAVLNFGIFGIAWFKAWRVLNWVGFVFTFVIATFWGARYYTPDHFATTEPFLILFVAFYVAITILFATRQPPRLRGLVDASLVFGVPTVGFALQSRLMRDFEFGLAYSAIALGIFYLCIVAVLWKRYRAQMRLLAEAFLALGVVFSSLAIPLSLDGHWTAAAWSLEAAGIIWIGLRQDRVLARSFGLLLQLGAAILFLLQRESQVTVPVVINSAFVGLVMISLAGLITAWLYARYRDRLYQIESRLELTLLVWGIAWWAAAVHHEVDLHAHSPEDLAWYVLLAGASALALAAGARKLDWALATRPPQLLLPLLLLFAGFDFVAHSDRGPFAGLYGLAWLAGVTINMVLLRSYAATWGNGWQRLWHAGSVWLITFLLTWAGVHFVHETDGLGQTWMFAIAGALPCAIIITLHALKSRIAWPIDEFPSSYCGNGLLPVVAFLAIWLLATTMDAGNPAPLAYMPILNPIEGCGLLALVVAMYWYTRLEGIGARTTIPLQLAVGLIGVLGFIWLNAVLFRTVHHFGDIPYDFTRLWRSSTLQATLSIAWTLVGSAIMALAALRFGLRGLWMVGAALLVLVVLKLFTVDLADIGTVARIVSFMGVGAVLLVIGYFAPLPPHREGS